jgi:hypothetical protein
MSMVGDSHGDDGTERRSETDSAKIGNLKRQIKAAPQGGHTETIRFSGQIFAFCLSPSSDEGSETLFDLEYRNKMEISREFEVFICATSLEV